MIRKILIPKSLFASENHMYLSDFAWTPKLIEELFDKPDPPRRIKYYRPSKNDVDKGSLLLEFTQILHDSISNGINWIILESLARPYFIRVTSLRDPQIFNLTPDIYRATLLLQDGSYLQSDALEVYPNGTNFYRIKKETFLAKDSLSQQLRQLLEDHTNQSFDHGDVGIEIESSAQLGDYIEIDGYIVEKNIQDPLTGALVATLDEKWGTITDLDGYFRLKVPRLTKELEVAYLGYDTRIIQLYGRKNFIIELSPSSMLLEEVVVTSYKVGLLQQDNVSSIRGTSSGVAYSKRLPQTTIANIKTSNISAEKRPLIILDDQLYSGNFEDINPLTIDKIEFLEIDEAIKLYGESGRNGAYIIYSKSESKQASPYFFDDFHPLDSASNRLRTDFRDNAFWQPKLSTDKNGKVRFKVAFPEDVTAWSTHYLAMNDKNQKGSFHSKIKSFKPVLAKLDVPRFLIAGDTSYVLGRANNYLRDTLRLSRYFTINEDKIDLGDSLVLSSLNDRTSIIANTDTLLVSYETQAENGIYDGEQRSIEIHPIGLEKVEGMFELLQSDTVLHIQPDLSKGPIYINAEANLIDFVFKETSHLTNYKYLCSEQLASKLNGYLLKKKILSYKGEPFNEDKKVEVLINELASKVSSTGLWGWWSTSSHSLWISHHIISSLLSAESAGYKIPIDFHKTKEAIALNLDRTNSFLDFKNTLILLKDLDVKIPEDYYLQRLDSLRDSSLSHFLDFLEVKSKYGHPFDPDTLLPFMQRNMLGYAFFKDTSTSVLRYNIHQHPYSQNFKAYWIFRRAGKDYEQWARAIKNYFFSERKRNTWHNTYFQSQILDILLDTIDRGTSLGQPSFTLNGEVIDQFPFKYIDSTNKDLMIEKRGVVDIYLTAYQKYWNTHPVSSQEAFNIQTELPDTLKAGEVIRMKVLLEVFEEASYVMLNIPIPASCSYASKPLIRWGWHAEYDRQVTNIYIEKLDPGNYEFYIHLLPRFTGSFSVNPAVASLMYFPPVNANNEISRVVVK